MGSGSSALGIDQQLFLQQEILRQKQLPLDCGDILDFSQAKDEIKRIREICHKLLPDDRHQDNAKRSQSDGMTHALHHEIKMKITERFGNLQDAFLSIDTNRDGFISRQEFKEACWRWCLPVDDSDFDHLNSLYPHQEKDISIDRGINYLEFVALVSNVLNYQAGCGENQPHPLQRVFCEKVLSNGSTMRESFRRLDVDGSGYLDKNEITRVLNAHKIEYSPAELNSLFQQFDINHDGLICYSEFVKMLQGSQAKK